jgi:hypothetical protein
VVALGDAGRWDRLAGEQRGCGYCAHPIRLSGHVGRVDPVTGELTETFTSRTRVDGVLLVACKTRRAAVCRPCAGVYRSDAYQLIRAGVSGGKNTAAEVGKRPVVFATFTAPSFGPVHTTTAPGGRCHPPRPGTRATRDPGYPVPAWAAHQLRRGAPEG